MQGREPLADVMPAERVHAHLLPREAWHPFPRWRERGAWSALPAALRQQTVDAAAQHAGKPWPSLPATLFLEYRRDGNRSRFERNHFERRTMLAQLVLGECVDGQGRFLDDIVDDVLAL